MTRIRALLLPLVLIAAACQRQPSPTVFVDPGLASLIPSDTTFVAGVRLQQIQSTPIYQRYIMQGKFPWVERFRAETGIDLKKDIWEVVIPHDGKASVVMLRGKFSEMGREPRLEREGIRRYPYKGHTLIGDENTAAVFLNPSTCVAGLSAQVKRIIDNRNTTSGMPAWLLAEVKKIPSTNQAWMAGKVQLPQLDQDSDSPAGNALQMLATSVESLHGGADLRYGVNAQITAATRAPEDAKRLRDALRGLLGLARLNTPTEKRQMLRLYDGVQVRNQGTTADITVNVAQDLLDELIQLIPQTRSAAELR
ncbi:MAG TPA: hypothetical protein VEQ63_13675 [Bryobacteraceae bacterium]|nr:hypothetical protein [Bryobacteraceae bacterium]